jgi:hypothetical protein
MKFNPKIEEVQACVKSREQFMGFPAFENLCGLDYPPSEQGETLSHRYALYANKQLLVVFDRMDGSECCYVLDDSAQAERVADIIAMSGFTDAPVPLDANSLAVVLRFGSAGLAVGKLADA